ncbi:sugar kinase [Alkalimonas collagenimarina]|uniref:Sugar kinase n=1 Tax=Alkalimonas collagenimarina TaxID=400390 RepID=A0ABT9H0G6_9GAMM|nr:sugar kinase [Alkalimonas collagenimarina]MDP4536802.1 sugar kinase [Alkalimonas collagenimarina]
MKKRIVMMGECMVEMFQLVENVYHQAFAGDVFNTAVYLKRSCETPVDVQFFTAVGTDLISDKLVRAVEREKVDTSLMFRAKGVRPGLYMINTDAYGERSFVYWRDTSAAKQVMQCFSQQGNLTDVLGCDMFYFSGITLAILSDSDRRALFNLIHQLKEQGSQIVFDPNYRPALWSGIESCRAVFTEAYQLADIAMPGLDDHKVLFEHSTVQQIKAFLTELDVAEMIIKDGKNGVVGCFAGHDFAAAAHQVKKVVDTTAAGDSFNGGYLAARLADIPPQDAVKYAARLAGFVVEHTGAIVNKEHFQRFWSRHRPSTFVL